MTLTTFYLIVLPTIMIVTPTIIQLVLTALRVDNRVKVPIWLIAVLTFILGLLMAFAATIVSTHGFADPDNPNEPHCATGAVTFVLFGVIITVIAQPLIGVIGGLIYRNNQRTGKQLELK